MQAADAGTDVHTLFPSHCMHKEQTDANSEMPLVFWGSDYLSFTVKHRASVRWYSHVALWENDTLASWNDPTKDVPLG